MQFPLPLDDYAITKAKRPIWLRKHQPARFIPWWAVSFSPYPHRTTMIIPIIPPTRLVRHCSSSRSAFSTLKLLPLLSRKRAVGIMKVASFIWFL
jgi:hypothetical protein